MNADELILSMSLPFVTEGVGGDYSAPTGRYRLETDDTSECLEVTIFNDIIFEDVEQFIGQLVGFELDGSIQATIPGVILQPQRTTIEITDNDGNSFSLSIQPAYLSYVTFTMLKLLRLALRVHDILLLSLRVALQQFRCAWSLQLGLLVREWSLNLSGYQTLLKVYSAV